MNQLAKKILCLIDTMTITERNQKLFELRHKLLMKCAEVEMVEREIYAVRQQYKDEQLGDLYEQMFGTN